MKDIDVLMLAYLVLEQEEIDNCFLRAYHRLEQDEKERIEDAGLQAQTILRTSEAEPALELVAKLGIQMKLGLAKPPLMATTYVPGS